MKRKKWSELEELTLLSIYSDLLSAGTLAKLRTREKKFKPIADHVNSVHHLIDPIKFPFKWSWRDVSIKVQNMRHQYLGVKQKIRDSNGEFNWKDGENHWENFMKYKEVFGDVELEVKDDSFKGVDLFGDSRNDGDDDGDEFLGFDDEGEREDFGEMGLERFGRDKKGFVGKRLGLLGAQVLELRDVVTRREERRREREWSREDGEMEREERRREREMVKEMRREERDAEVEGKEVELEEREIAWMRRESEWRLRMEREFDEERMRRIKVEEKWEEEEMEWRERMVKMQIEHEKQMMQMHADACQNQMQVLQVMGRFMCQFFGSGNDGLGGGLGTLPHQILQHPGGLGDGGKPDANSPSEFL
ncbi:ABRE binding factor 4 [Heracleum sosnowskyi]|uniref:ABRE binding factor 4 n=1 Tax=Heracleum sosnowskyi TaxID=360622 RepID=A0AAD8LWX7_9APIA|nr:ABRE binding factor 4 [Heracleum sosnowskyi]